MVTEGIGIGAIDSFCISFRDVVANVDTLRKLRFRRRPIHFNEHVIAAAYMLITHLCEQLLGLFCLTIYAQTRRKTQFSRDTAKGLESASLRPLQHPCANPSAFIHRIHASPN